MSEIKCIPFTGVSDGPYMGSPHGTLSSLQNMRLRKNAEKSGYYAEARGGMEKLKPTGGTAADPVPTGGTTAGIQVSTSNGWVRTFATAGSVWSGNLQFSEGNFAPFAAGSVNDAFYFGADSPFARIGVGFQLAAAWTVTLVHEYWNGAAWTALTTQETIDWTHAVNYATAIHSYSSWQVPPDWAATVVGNSALGNVLKYWMRIRVSVSTAVVTLPTLGLAIGYWTGMRELYLLSQQPYSVGPNGRLMRYDQSAAATGTAQYFQAAATMYSSPEAIPSVSAYRGRLVATNPKETVRWDGRLLQNLGNVAPGTAGSARAATPNGIGPGIWRHYLAWGYGPLQNYIPSIGNVGYMSPLYGVSQATLVVPTANADPLDANSIVTTAGNEYVTVSWAAITIPADASCLVIYRTKDLTNVPIYQRSSYPADPVFCMNRLYFSVTATSVAEAYQAIDGAPAAVLYDNRPPKACRFGFVFENRMFLMGGPDETVYWSDPFMIDQWNNTFQNVPLTRAQGGRQMGGIEYGDQAVLFTEDQTWGLANPGLDVPSLFPIDPGVGCVAPFSAAVGDGWLIWLARDGVHAWNGAKSGPQNVNGDYQHTFASMNFEAHGGSRAVIHNHKYDLTLIDSKNGTIGNAYTLDLETFTWSTRTTNDKKVPLCLIHAPLGHADSGVPHALYAKATVGTTSASDATSYSPCVAEYTTQDDGTSYVCSGTQLFPVLPPKTFKPRRVVSFYQTDAGWGTPTLAASGTPTGSSPGTLNTGTPATGTDYSIVTATYSASASGSSDLKVTFSATSAAGGAIGAQRLFGSVLEGEDGALRKGF